MKFVSMIFVISAFLLISCGEKQRELKQAMEIAQNAPQIAKNMDNYQQQAQARRAERVKKGDTLTMPFQKLHAYLPASIRGYTAGELQGETLNMPGASYTNVSREFTKEGTTENRSVIEIKILDYNATDQLFYAAAPWLNGFSREDAKSYDKSFDPGIKWVNGFEHFDKVNKSADVNYAIGFRFLMTIHGTNVSSTDELKNIAKSMKISELANM